ncbi:MAG TPA: RluA family pseudouridine synthase [Candidatus Paceibacterota bacterium]
MEVPQVIFEDNDVLAVNKPSGLMVHSDGKTSEPTLVDWVLEQYPELAEVGEPGKLSDGREIARPGIVHRLDRDTSGIMVVAKNQKAFEFLKSEFKNRRIKKIYNAFVYGALPEKEGTIALPIGKSRKDFPRWSAEKDARGTLREAVTDYRVLLEKPEASFVEVSPKTGRTHQIRVHFKALRHPIICDDLYAPNRSPLLGFKRLALHALSLELTLPSGARIKLETPLPQDFEKAKQVLAKTVAIDSTI